jgi:hypothetical protein
MRTAEIAASAQPASAKVSDPLVQDTAYSPSTAELSRTESRRLRSASPHGAARAPLWPAAPRARARHPLPWMPSPGQGRCESIALVIPQF